jgi:hypothetical protein
MGKIGTDRGWIANLRSPNVSLPPPRGPRLHILPFVLVFEIKYKTKMPKMEQICKLNTH